MDRRNQNKRETYTRLKTKTLLLRAIYVFLFYPSVALWEMMNNVGEFLTLTNIKLRIENDLSTMEWCIRVPFCFPTSQHHLSSSSCILFLSFTCNLDLLLLAMRLEKVLSKVWVMFNCMYIYIWHEFICCMHYYAYADIHAFGYDRHEKELSFFHYPKAKVGNHYLCIKILL